jgi:hypothetical protein
MYARGHEYLVSGEKGVEDAKEWQCVFVLRKTDLCVYGVSTEIGRNERAGDRKRTSSYASRLFEGGCQPCCNQTNRRSEASGTHRGVLDRLVVVVNHSPWERGVPSI